MKKTSRIYVAGHKGMVGSAIVRHLKKKGYTNIIGKCRSELDLTNQLKVELFFKSEKPEYVFLAAAKVGGIIANSTYPADFIMVNQLIQCNIIKSSYENNVKKLMFLGSSCIYPKSCPQPIKEEYLLTGPLEPTNEAYAIAKISGLKMCMFFNRQYGTNYISVMPSNLYGPNDKYDLANSHVIPALMMKIHEAKTKNRESVEIWGTGKPLREFLYVEDLADACVYLMNNYNNSNFINIGTGKDIRIAELAFLLKDIISFKGSFIFNTQKPDGTPKKVLDISKLKKTGWQHKVGLEEGLRLTYQDYINKQ